MSPLRSRRGSPSARAITARRGAASCISTACSSVAAQSRVLDVGCGAGVLAIAAAKVLRRKVWLGDIDPIAVEVTNANARLNGVGVLCQAIVSRGVENGALARGARLTTSYSPTSWRSPCGCSRRRSPRSSARTGDAIVSGLLLADVPGVLASWRARGVSSRRADRARRLGEPQTATVKSRPPSSRICRVSVVLTRESARSSAESKDEGGDGNGEDTCRGRPQAASDRRPVRRDRRSRPQEAAARPLSPGERRLHFEMPDHRRIARRASTRRAFAPSPATRSSRNTPIIPRRSSGRSSKRCSTTCRSRLAQAP